MGWLVGVMSDPSPPPVACLSPLRASWLLPTDYCCCNQLQQVPVVITETGVSDRRHTLRAAAITSYYQEVLRAVAAGADVKGVYYWTLMDNIGE
jgi:hypothetical protein